MILSPIADSSIPVSEWQSRLSKRLINPNLSNVPH